MNTYKIGQSVEQYACSFLEMQGLILISRNYRCYVGEIDLIMNDRDDFVFVEVRYRASLDYGHPVESIDTRKMKKLIRAATHFLQVKKWLYTKNSRFDVVALYPDKKAGSLTCDWIKHAFSVDQW